MPVRSLKPLFLLAIFVLVVGLACSLGGDQKITPVPPTNPPRPTDPSIPTQPIQPTDSPAPTMAPAPTKAPVIGNETGDALAVPLDTMIYEHSEGLFTFYPPVGWEQEEDNGSVSYVSSDGSGYFYLQVTNIGYDFDSAAFERFIDAREENFFGTFEAYRETGREIESADRAVKVSKTLDFNGVPQSVYTNYEQIGSLVYAHDFWADNDKVEIYSPTYSQIDADLTFLPTSAEDQNLYLWIYAFNGPADLFTIDVPTAWRYERTSGETAVVDTFYSPDNHAVIQNFAFEEGTGVSESEASAFALSLLKIYSEDLSVTGEEIQTDGSLRLTWVSPSNNLSGLSFFESRETRALLFTVMWDDPFKDTYQSVLDYTISTYVIP